MTSEELRAMCLEVLEADDQRTCVLLVVPKDPPPQGLKARLFERSGPLGEVVNYLEDRKAMVGYWPAAKVLKFLDAHKL